jgi:methionyl-tRNA formyltransferase
LRVAFAGTPEFALPALVALHARHEIVGVLTPPDRPSGRGRQLTPSAVKSCALELQLPIAQPANLKDRAAVAQLQAWNPDVLVVVAYGLLLPPPVLELPRRGCLNIHASLLPRWRGAAPIERAILAGDGRTGVTIMQMDRGLDTGPMLLQRPVPISDTDTGGTLSVRLAAVGAEALLEVLDGLERGDLTPTPQPADGVTYAAKISKAEARIDWTGDASGIAFKVRAFNPRPIAETLAEGEQLRVLTAEICRDLAANELKSASKEPIPGDIIAIRGDSMTVQCGTGALDVQSVQRPGKRAVSGREYAQGRLGQHLG